MRSPLRSSSRPLRARSDALALAVLAIVALAVRAIPVLFGGGLRGLQGYDDGVYFGAAAALVHGVVPYRDFLLLLPPGNVVLLAPFAIFGRLTDDASGLALARASYMALGAASAVLAALVAGRYGRLAGLTAGALYAVWSTASNAERNADLHAPQNALLLIGLLALTRQGRIGPRSAAVAGVALGLATAFQLWQAVSVAVVLVWIVVRSRGPGRDRWRAILAYLAGAGVAFGLVCLPFFAAAPEAMFRYVVVDQLGRPSLGVDLMDRLRVLEGFAQSAQLPAVLRALLPGWLVLAAAFGALALVAVVAWRCPWTRPWAALAIVQSAVVLATPSFYNDYPSLVAPATTLTVGTGLAGGAGWLAARGRLPPIAGRAAIAAVLVLLATVSLARREGESLPLADLEADVLRARCVTANAPALLILTSALRHDLDSGCQLVLDPSGTSYDTDRGRLLPGGVGTSRRNAPGYQQAMLEWYTSGDVALFAQPYAIGLSPATEAAIRQQLPIERQRGIVTVRLRSP